jgi:hypothetical protein
MLGITGVMLLLFDAVAFKKADALRGQSSRWDEQIAFDHLNVYLETYWVV